MACLLTPPFHLLRFIVQIRPKKARPFEFNTAKQSSPEISDRTTTPDAHHATPTRKVHPTPLPTLPRPREAQHRPPTRAQRTPAHQPDTDGEERPHGCTVSCASVECSIRNEWEADADAARTAISSWMNCPEYPGPIPSSTSPSTRCPRCATAPRDPKRRSSFLSPSLFFPCSITNGAFCYCFCSMARGCAWDVEDGTTSTIDMHVRQVLAILSYLARKRNGSHRSP
jgi:hypothetical protein